MKALLYESFQSQPIITQVPDPSPSKSGVVIDVKATGLCRSDWHGWMGHDEDIELPHVPGHEFAGIIQAVGSEVKNWKVGDRVTVPFVSGCGKCPECASGNHQVCDDQFQPGFTHWGSFAEFVAIDRADINLVMLPETMTFQTAASLGCRFATSFRAVVDQGKVIGGQWVAIHGCGGVGLSAIMIANALGAQVIAIDIDQEKLKLARKIGAVATIDASNSNVIEVVREISKGGVHVSVDALGSPVTLFNSVSCLRKRGKHIQVGLLLADQKNSAIPMNLVLSKELEIYGSHGMQAWRYPEMVQMITAGKMNPKLLIGNSITLEAAAIALTEMNEFRGQGLTIIDQF
ncbi:MAG: zinc-dependent alcohol dehydrogenase family protein [Algoriphagus sp.]|uniref:zinc-dependent alcohol dehydrogenase family protein n=1 Tax=Algoriphagus sp. TaxID=1872435 RepID=UPI00260F032D|nr:zinc-dependent alcohol dehydrogenase family protein [Algoriphagus sp.]MDG1278301.1 zinc-dependent alcohol dehydrogenase family protein [Algoriphagus sp.]